MKPAGNVGIVVLNYLNYWDTVECVKSSLKLKSSNYKIVVVDNGSNNKSYEILKSKFAKNKKVIVIRSEINLGFAKGNNIGIAYARENLKCNYVFCINNDTVFTDLEILSKLLSCYREGYGVIGPKITGKDGKNQNPIPTGITYKKLIRDLVFSAVFSIIDIETLKSNYLISKYLSTKKLLKKKLKSKKSSPIILHGSAIMFTPDFFEKYSGFYPGTFLYYEENILAVILTKINLKTLYCSKAGIYHKEDKSSELSFGNISRKKSRLQFKSILRCLLIKLLPFIIIKRRDESPLMS